jgi:hypothetical protein
MSILYSILLFLSTSATDSTFSIGLPFSINIGETKAIEIEDKLSLVDKEHKLFQKDIPYTKYQVAGGQFAIYTGLNGTINKVIFDGDEDHTLPSNLRKLGLKLSQGKKCDIWGTSRSKLLDLLEESGIKDIEKIDIYDLGFVVDDLYVKAVFQDVCGLNELHLTENY